MAYTERNIGQIKRVCHMNVRNNLMKRSIFLTVVLGVLLLTSVYAYQFSPLEQTFQPSGAESSKTYTIVNDSNDSIAISISALTRDQDAQGNEINAPADAYFSIVPNKLVVPPQSSWVVRVQYRRPPNGNYRALLPPESGTNPVFSGTCLY